ncbi:MAG: elongation factor G [Oscillospiraceae bacterium]|jgi:elongation factor G|nr:elongation factor G [Oscillospiraceae bacterium]
MSAKVRNIALLGHGGSGKTSLAESILYLTGQIDRLGRVSDGNTTSDSDSEETKRKISISASLLYTTHKDVKINVIDTPGYFDFVGEALQAISVVDAGIIVQGAKGGVSVGTEKSWEYLDVRNLPRMVYISKLEEENADFNAVYTELRAKFGNKVCPVVIPMMTGTKFEGVIDIVAKKAYVIKDGKPTETTIPDNAQATVDEYYGFLAEGVAETSEELMEKFFAGEPFSDEEVLTGVSAGVREGTIVPVVCGSAFVGSGTMRLLDMVVNLLPAPEVSADPTSMFVFKTTSDQYGKFSYFKVMSGTVTADANVTNVRTGSSEKLGHIYIMQGKKNTEVRAIECGDIGAVSKLADTKTSDTLRDPKSTAEYAPIAFPRPVYSMAIFPKTKGQEDKIAQGLTRLGEEDYTFKIENNAETHQMVVSGTGDIQLDVICSRLKSKFGVETELTPARVPYRETIRKKTDQIQGRHKKQSGGHGQFGDVKIVFEPGESEELTFVETVFGGSVPKNFFPAVEKGLRESTVKGVLAGYPVVFLKATLVDGSYHPVDSSEMAFKLAAAIAYKEGLPKASPTILEPIGTLKVLVPDHYMGDIIGDLNKRRGRVLGMNPVGGGKQEIEAEVPMSEMSSYAIDLRSMTQSRGSFSIDFARYEDAPSNIQQKIIEESKLAADAHD